MIVKRSKPKAKPRNKKGSVAELIDFGGKNKKKKK
jgi:hypothetical protein